MCAYIDLYNDSHGEDNTHDVEVKQSRIEVHCKYVVINDKQECIRRRQKMFTTSNSRWITKHIRECMKGGQKALTTKLRRARVG